MLFRSIEIYVPGENGLEHIHVDLQIQRISTERKLKDGVKPEDKGEITNMGEDYEHFGLLNKPEDDHYLTFIPRVPGYSTATFDLSPVNELAHVAVESVTEHDSQEIPTFNAVDPNTKSYHLEWGFSSEALDNTPTNAGYLMYVTVLSEFGQMRVAQVAAQLKAENDARPEGEKLTEAQLMAELEKEYLKHTWEYPIHVVPANMNLNISVNYTRGSKNGSVELPETLTFENGSYSVFDYKENEFAENLTVTPVDNTNMKIQIWAADEEGGATGLNPLFESTADGEIGRASCRERV